MVQQPAGLTKCKNAPEREKCKLKLKQSSLNNDCCTTLFTVNKQSLSQCTKHSFSSVCPLQTIFPISFPTVTERKKQEIKIIQFHQTGLCEAAPLVAVNVIQSHYTVLLGRFAMGTVRQIKIWTVLQKGRGPL